MRPRFLSLVHDGPLEGARAFVQALGPDRGTLVTDLAALERETAAWKAFSDAGHDLAVRVPLRLATAEPPDAAVLREFTRSAGRFTRIVRVPDPLELALEADVVLQGGGPPLPLEVAPATFQRIRPWILPMSDAEANARIADVLENAAPGAWLVPTWEGADPASVSGFRDRARREGWVVRSLGEMRARFGPASAYEGIVDLCGNLDRPGAAVDVARLVDYVAKGTTPDQLRIEHFLDAAGVDGLEILHVGVGNSSLAKRFARKARRIVGLTVADNELRGAETLGIANYRVVLESKYSPRMRAIGGRFDVVVDNNLASFACCRYHFYAMFDAYLALLKPGGRILTDAAGMQWSAGDARWKLGFEDLVKLERKLPVVASRLTEHVFALTSLRDD